MNSNDIYVIIDRLSVIKNSKIYSMGTEECGDLWIKFIDEFDKIYILLIRTFFRFCNSEKILITDSDKYEPSNLFKSSSSYDEYSYDFRILDSSILHEWLDNNEKKIMINLKVQDIQINTFGDLQLQFDNDISLTVYLETTSHDECWCFFEESTNKIHDFIVYGNGIS